MRLPERRNSGFLISGEKVFGNELQQMCCVVGEQL